MEITARQPGFVKIRYKLEGDFPVEGWVPEAALGTGAITEQKVADTQQPYQVQAEPSTPSAIPDLNRQALSEKIDPSIKVGSPLAGAAGRTSPAIQTPAKIHKRTNTGPWLYETHVMTGLNFWKEALTSKLESTNAYSTEPFISYEMQGFLLSLEGEAARKFKDIEAGGFLSYDLSIFRGQVPSASSSFNPHIRSTSVQALLHEINFGPFVRLAYPVAKKVTLIPEARVYGSFSQFTTNQLQTVSDSGLGLNAQSVLFSYTSMQAGFEFIPRVSLPYHLTVSPHAGLGFFTYFSEGPIVTTSNGGALDTDDQIRTGSPNGADFAISYGAKISWNLQKYGWETLNLVAAYRVRDYSKKFSGQGNRAGIKTIDAKSEATTESFSLGAEYLF